MVVVEFVAELLRVFGGLYNLENFGSSGIVMVEKAVNLL
jgi:hypothetical protein